MKRVFVSIVAMAVLLIPASSFALAINPLPTPFGGKILASLPCTCNPGSFLLTVGPPKGGTFIYTPFLSRLYQFFKPVPPSWALGMAAGRAPCMGVLPACTYNKVITIFGTSLF